MPQAIYSTVNRAVLYWACDILRIVIDNMEHLTKPDEDAEFVGGSLQGGVDCSYKTLVSIFGKHHFNGDGYKVDAEWEFDTPFGRATIYNYKDGKNYNGREGTAIRDLTDWHIGGNNTQVVVLIQSIVEAYEKGLSK